MEQFEICVTSELTNLASIAEFVTQRALVAGMNEDQAFEVQMAVDEPAPTPSTRLSGTQRRECGICCYIEGDDFVVRVTDEGQPFDPSIISSRYQGSVGRARDRRVGTLFHAKTDG